MKKLFLATVFLAMACSHSSAGMRVSSASEDLIVITNENVVSITGPGIPMAGIRKVSHVNKCDEADLKKALALANRYLPTRQREGDENGITSVWVIPEKESDRLRIQADELDQKDKDLQFIQDVINDKCD